MGGSFSKMNIVLGGVHASLLKHDKGVGGLQKKIV